MSEGTKVQEEDPTRMWGGLFMLTAVAVLAFDRLGPGGGENSTFLFWFAWLILLYAAILEIRSK